MKGKRSSALPESLEDLRRPDNTEKGEDMDDDDPVERTCREFAARVFWTIRRVRRKSGMPGSVADISRELIEEWWELCVGTWQEEERRRAVHEDLREFSEHVGVLWEPRANDYTSLEDCIQVYCRWLERILLARLKQVGEPDSQLLD